VDGEDDKALGMDLLNSIITYVFHAFAIFIIISSPANFKGNHKNIWDRITNIMTLILRVCSLGFLVVWFMKLPDQMPRLTGPYWSVYFIIAITFGALPQLLWIRKVRESKAARVVLACLFEIVLNFEKMVIIITSFHRDYI